MNVFKKLIATIRKSQEPINTMEERPFNEYCASIMGLTLAGSFVVETNERGGHRLTLMYRPWVSLYELTKVVEILLTNNNEAAKEELFKTMSDGADIRNAFREFVWKNKSAAGQ